MIDNKIRAFALGFISFFLFIFTFISYSARGYAIDFLSDYVVNYLFDRTTNNDSFKDLTSYTLQNNFTQLQIDRINGIAQDYRYNEYGERIGYANGNGGRGIGTPSRDVPSNSQPIKIYTNPSGGSHGGGGHSRETSLPIVETPTSSPVSVVENNQIYNFVTNEYETINNSYYYTNNYNSYYDINVYETEEYYITYEFNNTYYTVCIAPMSSPTDTEYFNVYYELPDGRSSFNLREEDIHGVVFNYDVIPYERTVTNDDVIGLWHLDGTFFNSIDNSLGYGNSSFVNGMFEGGFQVPWFPSASFSPQGINVAYLRFNDSLSSDWTLQFKMYVPVSTIPGDFIRLDAIGDGYSTHVATSPFPYTMDCWYDVAIDSLGHIYLDGNLDSSSSLSNYVRGCIEVNNGFVSLKHTSSNIYYYSPSGDVYGLEYGVGVVFDEVKLTNSIISSFDIRREPWDLNFVYTVPNIESTYIIDDYEVAFEFENDFFTPFFTSSLIPSSLNYTFEENFTETCFPFVFTDYTDDLYVDISFTFYSIDEDTYTVDSSVDLSSYNFEPFTKYYFRVLPRKGSNSFGGQWIDLTFLIYDENFRYIYQYPIKHIQNLSFPPYDSVFEFFDNYLDSFTVYMIFQDSEFVTDYHLKSYSNVIALQTSVAINRWQIGGVRSSEPLVGDVFISLYNNRPSSITQYYNGIWNVIRGAVWYGGRWEDLQSFDFSRMMIISDSDGYSSGNTYNYYYYDSSIINNDYDIDITQIDNNYFEDAKDFIFSLPELLLIVPTLISSVSWLGGLGALLLVGFTVLIGLIIYKLVRR